MDDKLTQTKKPIPCAIYTRVSTNDGMEQEFTSLDSQRESAENYIASQKSEGFFTLADKYNDAGFSGATTERPALQKLITDIKIGKIGCVVVYKVDRLSRSLLDFSKLLEFFDQNNVAFISVTQHFNTNSSMGRLTLNILLSFAQFEREIISERTRDKMGAARKKGQWMGGRPALGYNIDKENHRIVINEAEAQIIREMFNLYIKERSLLSVAMILNKKGYRTKSHIRKGKQSGNIPFKATSIQLVLRNMLYIGKINYKGKHVYQGQHEPIITEEVFNQAQTILDENRREKKVKPHKNTGLLSQIARCKPCDSSMAYAYSTKKRKWKYFYYVCLNAQKRGYENCPTKTINALRFENQIMLCLRQISDDQDIAAGIWKNLPFTKQREIILPIVKVILYEAETKKVYITLHNSPKVHEFKIDLETSLIIKPPKDVAIQKEPKLRQALILAYQIQELLSEGKIKDLKQAAGWLNITHNKTYLLMNMLMLAPSIQEAILFSDNNLIQLIPEYKMNEIAREISWNKQKKMWQAVTVGLS
ncbi:MAG: recombinase family protein [Candidatus Omnitrophica bacterium]|nr:recombinase family protein [Candidatus Omnitrophota bacterium]